jgi:hypothetical protein
MQSFEVCPGSYEAYIAGDKWPVLAGHCDVGTGESRLLELSTGDCAARIRVASQDGMTTTAEVRITKDGKFVTWPRIMVTDETGLVELEGVSSGDYTVLAIVAPEVETVVKVSINERTRDIDCIVPEFGILRVLWDGGELGPETVRVAVSRAGDEQPFLTGHCSRREAASFSLRPGRWRVMSQADEFAERVIEIVAGNERSVHVQPGKQ